VQKHPVELDDDGILRRSFKESKAGRLKLIRTQHGYKTIRENELPHCKSELVTVFENGEILREYDFEEIRRRLACYKSDDVCLRIHSSSEQYAN
jgi:nicotinamide phosphoribosyltransferase